MKFPMQKAVVALLLCVVAFPATAGSRRGIPAKVSQQNGWHGTRIEKSKLSNGVMGCEIIFPPDFGIKPGEVKLLQELVLHFSDMKYDLKCAVLADYDALTQLVKLAVRDQNREAAELIVFGLHNGKFGLDGDLQESFGESYIYPVLLKYNDLADIIPKKREKELAQDICLTAYNPSTGDDFDLDKLIKHLKKKKMNSFVNAINRECDRVAKETAPQ